MAQNTFNPGDVVKLNSGGPAMTVSRVDNGVVRCVWYNEAQSKFEDLRLAQTVLVKQTLTGQG
ncbi:MAG: DUF2158 domain-containing protein [Chitinophagaceae bacterium]